MSCQLDLGGEDDEAQQLAVACSGTGGVDHEGILDLGEGLDHAVELRRSHPDTAAVQGGITTAVDDG